MSTRLSRLGMPPPIPTINPNRKPVKVRSMFVATVAAALLPSTPAGRHAITTLWLGTGPNSGPSSRPRCHQLEVRDPNGNPTGAHTNARAWDSPPEGYIPEPVQIRRDP